MPKRAAPFVLTIAPNPKPRYPSLQAALEANVSLIAALIKAGEAAQQSHPSTGLEGANHADATPPNAA